MQDSFTRTGVGATVGAGNPNLNRERRVRYQHPKGAPDADLIFGSKSVFMCTLHFLAYMYMYMYVLVHEILHF